MTPNMLKQGQKDEVLIYLQQCREFWKMGATWLDLWEKKIHAGQVPNFFQHAMRRRLPNQSFSRRLTARLNVGVWAAQTVKCANMRIWIEGLAWASVAKLRPIAAALLVLLSIPPASAVDAGKETARLGVVLTVSSSTAPAAYTIDFWERLRYRRAAYRQNVRPHDEPSSDIERFT